MSYVKEWDSAMVENIASLSFAHISSLDREFSSSLFWEGEGRDGSRVGVE